MSNRKASWLKHLDFMVGDVFCLFIAYAIACLIRHSELRFLGDSYYQVIGVMIAISSIFTGFVFESYHNILRRGYYREFRAVFMHTCITALGLLVFMFFVKSETSYSRLVFMWTFVIGLVLMYGTHLLWKKVIIKRAINNTSRSRLMVITKKDFAEELISKLSKKTYVDYQIVGCILYDQKVDGLTIDGVPIVCDFGEVTEYLKGNVVDEVLIQPEKITDEDRGLIREFVDMGITVHIELTKIFGGFPDMRATEFGGYKVLTISIHQIRVRQILVKRVMDILGSIIGLVVTGLAFVIVGPIIKKQSPGPIIFSQIRVGKSGRKFKIYKFRSMCVDAEEKKQELAKENKVRGLMFKVDNDPRVTSIGSFIRKYSIDELPQFWNVLKGDMSLVGTRPPTVDEYQRYDTRHRIRLSIKPGMTGMWQVNGRSDIIDFEEVVKLDEKYIREWSLGLDIKILLQTFLVVFWRKGSS